jgi:hypothetical protein
LAKFHSPQVGARIITEPASLLGELPPRREPRDPDGVAKLWLEGAV